TCPPIFELRTATQVSGALLRFQLRRACHHLRCSCARRTLESSKSSGRGPYTRSFITLGSSAETDSLSTMSPTAINGCVIRSTSSCPQSLHDLRNHQITG